MGSHLSAVVILSTCRDSVEAERISRAILEKRLAACVNIVPVRSRYVWKGSIEEAEEDLLIIKTRGDKFRQVEKLVKAMHSYEVPELIALKVLKGSKPYLDWLLESART